MDRSTLQQLADLRVRDAEVLMAAGQWEAAYYLLGYSVECALKACIVTQFLHHKAPDKKLVNDFYTHRFGELLRIAGLAPALEVRTRMEPAFAASWKTVLDWRETSRYEAGLDESVTQQMFLAVTDREKGIVPWLKTQW